MNLYLIPGQGADQRLFEQLKFSTQYTVHHIKYATPSKSDNMERYAKLLAEQIDQSQPFGLIGTSLGGMLATEMGDFLSPEKIILISSAKTRNELPLRYRFQKRIPLYAIIPPAVVKLGAKILQPLVEPDRNNEKKTFKAMLNSKDPRFLSRTVRMIIQWNREGVDQKIIHIHGNKDKTLPLKLVKADYVIENGSHMMTLTRGKALSALIEKILAE